MFFSVRRRFFSGRKSSSSSWSWLREAWNFWERREAKDSFFGCSDANDGTGKKKAGVTAPWLHEYITSSSLWDWDVKKQHSLNIYGHSAGAAVMTVLLDMGWKLVFRRRANNRTEAFLLLLIGQEKHFFFKYLDMLPPNNANGNTGSAWNVSTWYQVDYGTVQKCDRIMIKM